MTRDYCLGFVTNVMLQDGDDHNHDPTVNWRLNINVERLGLTSRNLVVVFSWTWWSWWWWWWWWWWTTALSEFYIFKRLNVQRTSAVAAEGREWWMEERRWLMCALQQCIVCIVAMVSRVMWCVQCNVCICAFAMTTSVKYCIITNICCEEFWRWSDVCFTTLQPVAGSSEFCSFLQTAKHFTIERMQIDEVYRSLVCDLVSLPTCCAMDRGGFGSV